MTWFKPRTGQKEEDISNATLCSPPLYYSVYDGITDPIVPLAPGCTPKNALTGASGAFTTPALKSSCFTLPLLQPGDLGGAIPANDLYETNFTNGQRNIFRQAWQKSAEISFVNATQLTERYTLKYSLDIFNLTNTASFDIPIDDVFKISSTTSSRSCERSPRRPPATTRMLGSTTVLRVWASSTKRLGVLARYA